MPKKLPKFSTFFIGMLIILNVLPVLAPILMHHGFVGPAKAIYFIYSFFCHQMSWRSIHLHDHQCAWCARDMAIWGSVLVVAVIIRMFNLKGLKLFHLIPFMIPIGLDGGIQTLASLFQLNNYDFLYISTNLMRMVTGSIFGIGVGLTLVPKLTLVEDIQIGNLARLIQSKIPINNLLVGIVTFLIVLSSYISLVGLWSLTGVSQKPENFLDHKVKLPTLEKTIIERRANAVCPVYYNATEEISAGRQLSLDCFFGKED